ncbi:CTLH, C-terminal LisH motif,Zinc finger, RING/FYVE/PHD-type,CTLH/CRA C-terminal to LisH motif [Cinara cedri]|uniref:CTLH, C-terminal LisH motif,Zinc finger, RING/FYVE/PHD-type,CTLH/CRA C-terminal to LisH motif n=1 Tax=Cinara cedri TaxID=506608 RepID=A0A5E4MXR7_9HEMI|nr:CTLH, C-terminal LisH motif,Zinc finger, RING/FYVE/PHD-type,CTLH/CRA C-terminal to LisH motif [Cinara cedri]
MEACQAVEAEIEKLLAKYNKFGPKWQYQLQRFISTLERYKREIDSNSGEIDKCAISSTILQMKLAVKDISNEHRRWHSDVSRIGKTIDKNFVADYTEASNKKVFKTDQEKELLNKIICMHLFRDSKWEVAEEFLKETGISVDDEQKQRYLNLNHIVDSLKRQDPTPAFEWVQQNKAQLDAKKSDLEFKLHQIVFLDILSRDQYEAVVYARAHFNRFVEKHGDIQSTMGMILFPPNLAKMRSDVIDLFIKDSCLGDDDLLSVCVNVGCSALPALLDIKQAICRDVGGVWNENDELPIKIDTGFAYHSVFACPILRTRCGSSNPPMMLVCGHVISKDALNKLERSGRLKCPYCPKEQLPSEARQIHF